MPSKGKLERQLCDAQSKIVNRFAEQCNSGRQNDPIRSQDASACGQYLLGDAIHLLQRGIHGTSSALFVLAKATDQAMNKYVPRIIKYLNNRRAIEAAIPSGGGIPTEKIDRDESNIIKISEVLYALSVVPRTIIGTESLIESLKIKLLQSKLQSGLWGYFVPGDQPDKDKDPELLPSAFAIYSLASIGEDVTIEAGHILEKLRNGDWKESSDISSVIFCLYVLTFRGEHEVSNSERKNISKLLMQSWKKLRSLVIYGMEQNIGYYQESKSYYIRVPWDLYLIALSYKLHPWRIFSSIPIQKRFRYIVDKVTGEGFYYPHSGKQQSSRTNAILYDVIDKILKHKVYGIGFFNSFHKVRNWLPWIYIPATICFIVYTIYMWTKNGNVEELGSSFIASLLLTITTFIKREK